jgi:hypothetical protein
MPRYYFHFSDGKHTFTDKVGLELTGFADLRSRVVGHIREIKGSLSDHRIQDWTDWKLVVTEESQVTILEVGFDLKPKPLAETESAGLVRAHQRTRLRGK